MGGRVSAAEPKSLADLGREFAAEIGLTLPVDEKPSSTIAVEARNEDEAAAAAAKARAIREALDARPRVEPPAPDAVSQRELRRRLAKNDVREASR